MGKIRKGKRNRIILYLLILIIIGAGVIYFLPKEKVKEPEPAKNLMIDLTNKTLSENNEFIEKYDFDVTINYEFDDTIEKDKVVSQSIVKDTEVTNKQELSVVISLGKLDLEKLKTDGINELGKIPVMMYHGIVNKKSSETSYTGGNVDRDGYNRTVEAFREDLEFYYQNGYRMVRLNDYVDGKIDVAYGYSPIVITFDDGNENNMKVTGLDAEGNIIIDENCAVGVLESFKKKYPDYNVTATFFINGTLFHQKEYNDKIIAWLLKNNYDIGNHTYGHANLSNISESATIKEVGSMYKLLKEKTDGQYVNIIALPFGTPYNTKHANFKHIISGTYDENAYETISTLQVGYESDYSPFSTSFNKTFIKRIRAYDNNGKDFDIEYNFKALEKNRYISDGNAKTVVVKKDNVTKVNSTKLQIISY